MSENKGTALDLRNDPQFQLETAIQTLIMYRLRVSIFFLLKPGQMKRDPTQNQAVVKPVIAAQTQRRCQIRQGGENQRAV